MSGMFVSVSLFDLLLTQQRRQLLAQRDDPAGLQPLTYVGNQDDWCRDYSAAHEKMSLLGIDKDTLTDCTELLPLSINLKNLALEAAIQQYRSLWL
ncbi:hypothetical protein B0H17DRAFT_1214398 [Mycena rosella]|uniref:Uncharacterized protein n=1 Tax=Mycena rosella TaxID=1033263 RepID=A0AAD7CN40_MYCRO|nr:hypothetical protein B0H17DRAFT_1214398 [Mycena rosella]